MRRIPAPVLACWALIVASVLAPWPPTADGVGSTVPSPLTASVLASFSPLAVGKFTPPTEAGLQAEATPWAPGEVLVRFREGVSRVQARAVSASIGGVVVGRVAPIGVDVVTFPLSRDLGDVLEALRADPLVEIAEPNLIRRIFQTPPDDPFFSELWGLHNTGQAHEIGDPPPATSEGAPDADLDLLEAWESQTGHPETVIAVLDSGVDTAHPDLVDSLWINPGEIPDNGIDDEGNGYVDDVNGYDFVNDDPEPEDTTPHGTHVAGIIAAQRDNDTGVAGVCPDCSVMALKIGEEEEIFLDEMLEAIAYATQNGAAIINGSFAGGPWSRLERDAFQAAGDAGILSVLAAGNATADNDLALVTPQGFLASPSFPASYALPTILSVAASNDRDEYGYRTGCALRGQPKRRCVFTSWGHDSVDVAAPGVDVLSTLPGSGYAHFNGTSMATPHVSGVAGLVKSEHPGYTPLQVKNAIMNSVDTPATLKSLDVLESGPSSGSFTRTDGRVNANAALTGDADANATALTDGNVAGAVRMTVTKSGQVSWPRDVNDVYWKRLVKGNTYRFTLDGPPNRDFDLWVWKPGTTEIWQFEPGCLGLDGPCNIRARRLGLTADETLQLKAFSTGRYYVQVTGFFSSGTYTLKVTKS
jgi:subtilisin family serine protease